MPEAIRQSPSEVTHRVFIYGVLLLFAVYFLIPFFVMFIKRSFR